MAVTRHFNTSIAPQRALVIHPQPSDLHAARSGSDQLAEAVGLAEAIHLQIAEALLFTLKRATPRTLLGAGQVAHCYEVARRESLDVIIINAQLSPTQQRNLEKATNCKVIDRTALILEIFGERAQTAEGRLQVELAALNYQKSRLVRSWTHLERQRGGHGFMGGPGESQIETDRRLIAERIIIIKKQLEKVTRTRELHRKTRRETPLPVVALVGYTNAGKSTLFNRLTEARVMAENMLFATLDPTIRAITLPSGQKALLSDTVGFISDLPHELVAAFRATLEEVLEADLLLHVRDISHPDNAAQAADVDKVLAGLLGEDKYIKQPLIEVWNKMDLMTSEATLPTREEAASPLACISAHEGDGLSSLLALIDQQLQSHFYVEKHYEIPIADGRALAWLHAHGEIHSTKATEEKLLVCALLRPSDAKRFEQHYLNNPTIA